MSPREARKLLRYTLDEWQTTIEVRARYVVSMQCLPWEMTHSQTLGDAYRSDANASNDSSTWDRFSFDISLEDTRTSYMSACYGLSGGILPLEMVLGVWDNNSGSNYRVGFKVAAGKVEIVSADNPVLPVRYLTTPQPTKGTAPTISPPSHFRTSHPHPLQQETKSSSSNNASAVPTGSAR